jgi:hypothetical protein
MNQRNVEALTKLLMDTSTVGLTFYERAQRLASHGVLVPSALTFDQAWWIGESVDGMTHTSEEALQHVVTELEKIAKGEV